jgi:hypothetical protein
VGATNVVKSGLPWPRRWVSPGSHVRSPYFELKKRGCRKLKEMIGKTRQILCGRPMFADSRRECPTSARRMAETVRGDLDPDDLQAMVMDTSWHRRCTTPLCSAQSVKILEQFIQLKGVADAVHDRPAPTLSQYNSASFIAMCTRESPICRRTPPSTVVCIADHGNRVLGRADSGVR